MMTSLCLPHQLHGGCSNVAVPRQPSTGSGATSLLRYNTVYPFPAQRFGLGASLTLALLRFVLFLEALVISSAFVPWTAGRSYRGVAQIPAIGTKVPMMTSPMAQEPEDNDDVWLAPEPDSDDDQGGQSDDEEGEGAEGGEGLSRKDRRRMLNKPRWYKSLSKNVSKGSKRIYRELWPRFGIDAPEWGSSLDLHAIFGRPNARVVLEVGFGAGDCLAELGTRAAAKGENVVFLGVEWHRGSVANGMKRLEGVNADNVRVYAGDFFKLLRRNALPPSCFDDVMIFFPDPWPKPRDAPRRVVRNEVIALLGPHVKEGGHLHIATDVRDYAAWAGSVMEQHTGEWEAEEDAAGHGSAVATLLPPQAPQEGAQGQGGREEPLQAFGLLPERPVWRPVTHYERRGIEELGHDIYDLCYRRRPHTQAS